ncbi:hypothetical protein [Convivina intestini]|uniref:hypothetical protein n=1 Tax=Convivina intestini TaxID=1505726 RepID=UPI00200EB14A|nr:hypothetical protein [Convivina intestini]CAH1851861.1 hypothetical protein R078131_00360 [Convivina intestini]
MNYKPEQRPFILVIFPIGQPLFIIPKLEENHFHITYFDYTLESYFDVTANPGKNWFDILGHHLQGLDRVGIESNSQIIISHFMSAINWDIKFLVQNQRMIKSNYELEKLQYVDDLASWATNETLRIAKTGMLVADAYQLGMKIGSEEIQKHFSLENQTINAGWPAEYSYMPHSIPALDATIQAGPNINIALFNIQGYAAECERTFLLKHRMRKNNCIFHK